MKIKLISTSAKQRQLNIELVGTSYIVSVDGVNTAKFSSKLKTEVISERLLAKGLKKVEVKRIFDQMAKMGQENVREVNAKPSDPTSNKKKKQLFSDATVRAVAKEFNVIVATLSQLTKEQRAKALSAVHHGLGTAVRNFIRTDTKESLKVVGNPITMDDIWKDVIERAIELKLYSENDVNIYNLAELTGVKVKELDLVMFKSAEDVKKIGSAIQRALVKTFGSGITLKARVRQAFSPANNVPAHKYNWFEVDLPNNMVTHNGLQRINIYLGKGVVFMYESSRQSKASAKERTVEVKLVKGTNAEVLEAITKNIRIKTNTIVKPAAVGKFNEASQYVVDTFGKDLMAKGIELLPTKGGINFYHARRGVVKAQFAVKNGKMMRIEKFKASFGEVFDISKKITKSVIDSIVKPLLK